MHALKFYLAISVICLSSIFNVQTGQHNLQEYNNLISQQILKITAREAFFTSQGGKKVTFGLTQPSSCSSASPDQTLEWKRDKTHDKPIIERFGQSFIIKQGNHTRSFSIKPDTTVVRSWFTDCQSIEVLTQDDNNNLSTQRYRVCHKLDLEHLGTQQLALFVHAKEILQGGRTPVIGSHDDYQTYLTLPESLQKAFRVCPELLPKPIPMWPAGKRPLAMATVVSMLLGGFITIF